MFDYTEAAVHAAMPEARFGGPSTCGARTEGAPATVFFHTKGGEFPADLKAKKQFPSVQEFLANIKMQTSVIKEFGYDKLECVLFEADPDGWAAGGRFDNKNGYVTTNG